MAFSGITDETEARTRIEEFIKTFGIKKLDNDTFEISTPHLISFKNARSILNIGIEWRCNCGVVNSAKNGDKCLKCDRTYRDWLVEQQEEFSKNESIKYQPITDREVACFLFGRFTSMISSQIPQTDNLEQRVQTSNIAGSITFDFMKSMEKHYTELREGEVFDVTKQLGNPETAILFDKILESLESDIKAVFNLK